MLGRRRSFHFYLDGKGYLLARSQNTGTRSWARSGVPDTPGRRSSTDTQYGVIDDRLDRPEVWDDWSAGFGYAYRQPDVPNGYHWAENFDARFPRQLIHAQSIRRPTNDGGGSLSNFVNGFLDVPHEGQEANHQRAGAGTVMQFQRKMLTFWNPAGPDTFIGGGGDAQQVSLLHRAANFGSFTYVGVLEATQFTRLDMLGAVINTDTHGMPGRMFAVAGNRLWRVHGPQNRRIYIQNTAGDPTVTSNWSATLSFGNGLTDANDILAHGSAVYLGAPNGLWLADHSGTFYNVLPELENQRHVDNCRDLTIHENAIIAPHIGGVYKYFPSEQSAFALEIGPALRSNRSPIRGNIRAVRNYGPWLLAGLWTGSQSYLMAGVNASPGLPYVWHPMQRLPNTAKVSRIHVDSITVSSGGLYQIPNRVWVATDASIEITGTAPVYFFEIPRMYGNTLNAEVTFSPPNYAGSARIDLGRTDWGAPGTPKVFREVEIWAENLAASAQYCGVYYTVDSGARTLLGYAQTSPKSTLFFPSGEGSFVTGQAIELSLESFTHSLNVSPVYRAIVLRGALRPKSVDLITAVVRIADNLTPRQGGPMRPGAVMLQELRDMATSGNPVKLVDLAGATSWVNVLAPIEEQEVYPDTESDDPEVAATVRMAVLNFSGS